MEEGEKNINLTARCSNFQTENVKWPQEVREWLVKNFNERFPTRK